MTGSEEESKSKVIEPSRRIQLQYSNNLSNEVKTQHHQLNTRTLNIGKSRFIRDGSKYSGTRDETVHESIDHRSTSSSSPRSEIWSGDISRRSRSSSLEEEVDSSKGQEQRILVDGVSTEIDKCVTSSSVIIDEEHANLSLSDEELELISKDEVITLYHRLQSYIDDLKRKHQDELSQEKEIETKVRSERTELSRREKVLIMRLTTRDRQLVEAEKEIAVLKKSIVPNHGALRSTLLDPAVNLIIQKLKKDLSETKKKLEDTQNDLNAWKFTPDSNTGKRLMAKCRMLYLENEDLGKQTSSGRVAKLENDLALNKQLVTEMKQSQAEMDEVVQELDEDIEGLQSAIQHLQKELRIATAEKSVVANSEGNSSFPSSNSHGNCGDRVSVNLSTLCAQCRLSLAIDPQQTTAEPPESTALRTSRFSSENDMEENKQSSGDIDHGKLLGSVITELESNERTSLVNGEIILVEKNNSIIHISKNYLQSVQISNVVNSNSPGRRSNCDGEKTKEIDNSDPDFSPLAKRTKFNMADGQQKAQALECHSSSSYNGNGSLNH